MSSPAPVIAVDANVIVRYLMDDHPELSQKATDILQAAEAGKLAVWCDPVNLAEVIWVLRSVYSLEREEISSGLSPLVKAEGFLVPDKERYVLALALFGGPVRDFGDACACAAATLECGGKLFSFDRKLSSLEGVERLEAPPGAGKRGRMQKA